MAARLGFSLRQLSLLHPAACASDARLVWKDGDRMNIGIVLRDAVFIQGIHVASTREMKLLGMQLIRHAENIEREDDDVEVVLK